MPSTKPPECDGFRMLRENDPTTSPKTLRAACFGDVYKTKDGHYCIMHAREKTSLGKFKKLVRDRCDSGSFNFRGVWFPDDVSFAGQVFRRGANFSHAVFNGDADFDSVRFTGRSDAVFAGAHFTSAANFSDARFESNNSSFRRARFGGWTEFVRAVFDRGSTIFDEVQFEGYANFSDAEFKGETATFDRAKFTFGVNFYNAKCKDISFRRSLLSEKVGFFNVDFTGEESDFSFAQFSGDTDFSNAQFSGKADFSSANFNKGIANFNDARFTGASADFGNTQFSGGKTSFRKTWFSGERANFSSSQFGDIGTDFSDAQFESRETLFTNALFVGGITRFENAKFTGENIQFIETQFGKDVIFSGAQFTGKADFNETRVNDGNAYFDNVTFGGPFTKFRKAWFSGSVYFDKKTNFANYLSFNNTVFGSHAFFDDAAFRAGAFIDFRLAHFMNLARFIKCQIEDGAECYFGEAVFEKPERVYFASIYNLQIRWFMNTDTREFTYEDVKFPFFEEKDPMHRELDNAQKLLEEIDRLDSEVNNIKRDVRDIPLPYKPLITVLRRMADNAETNGKYDYASIDRKMAFETEKLERAALRKKWSSDLGNTFRTEVACNPLLTGLKRSFGELGKSAKSFPVGVPQFLYRSLSDYGESWWRALVMLFLIWLVFAVLYLSPLTSFYRWDTKISDPDEYKKAVNENKIDREGRELKPDEAFTYSFAVMALQKPEPKPLGVFTGSLVLIETVFAPLQLALLALALRRKFMR